MAEQPRRVVQVGVVTSTRMQKTVRVLVERRRQHPRYKRYLRERTTYLAHDERGVAREGDWVEIIQTRPLSRRKRWRLLRVLARPGGLPVVPASELSVVSEPESGEVSSPPEPDRESAADAEEQDGQP